MEEHLKDGKRTDDDSKKYWKKWIIGLVIGIIILLFLGYLDGINYFTNIMSNNEQDSGYYFHLYNIHLYNWICFIGPIFAVVGTYIFTSIENQKHFDKELIKQENEKDELKKQFQREKEYQREISDNELIMSLFRNGIIREETLWISNRKQYKARINYMKKESINEPIDAKKVRECALKDIRSFYNLYADIEIINEYVESKKYKSMFSKMIDRKEGKNSDKKIFLDPELVIKEVRFDNYKDDIDEIRIEYIEKMLKIIK